MDQSRSEWRQFWRKLSKRKISLVGGAIILAYIFIAILAPWLAPHDPLHIQLDKSLIGPVENWNMNGNFWLGTDDKGRDILSRILYGARLSLLVGVVAVSIGALIGVPMGLVAGYYGGWWDTILMRIIDVLLAFPGMLLALAIVSALGPSLFNVMLAVGIFSIPTFARLVRGSTLTVKRLEYIDAIRALGAGDFTIVTVHILPNVVSPIIVQGTLRLATAILTAAGLSFLGMGAQPPTPEWGAMLSNGRDFIFSAPYVAVFPGLAIAFLVIGFNLFGDGLRDALDQRMG